MARNRDFGESAEQNQNPAPRDPNLATEKQVAFIHRLLDEKDLFKSPSFFDRVNAMDEDELVQYIASIKKSVETTTKARAGDIIDALINLPNKNETSRNFTPDTNVTAGVYEVEGVIYIVKPNRDKTRLYAKRLVEINAERATEAGTRVEIEFEYEAGAMRKIKPEHKMSVDKAKELTIRYGRCIVCGRHLKAAESVERGIGPICIKSFA